MAASICFLTGHVFGFRALSGILAHESFRSGSLEIRLLLTLEVSKKEGTVGFHDFSTLARQHKMHHIQTTSIKTPEVEGNIRASNPDYILAIGLSELLPPSVLDIPKEAKSTSTRHGSDHGCIGMHPTLLPFGRGRAPIPWTIIHNIRQTGVTAFLLEEAPDAGGVVFQDGFSVAPDETATSLFEKCADAHERLGNRLAPVLAAHSLAWKPQDESKVVTWPKRQPRDGEIDFSQPAQVIERLVRALNHPYPAAFFDHNGGRVSVHKLEITIKSTELAPGRIVSVTHHGYPVISVKDGFVTCSAFSCPDPNLEFRVGDLVGNSRGQDQ